MMDHVYRIMQSGIEEGVFPGGVLLVAQEERLLFFEAFGCANIFDPSPVKKDTIFDLASLTKPLATTLAVLKLVEQGRLHLTQSIGSILNGIKDSDKAAITIRHLLCHNSGLPAYQPYFEVLRTLPVDKRKSRLRELLALEALEYATGTRVVYSDLGFMVLCWIVEEIAQIRLDRFVRDYIYDPLGIDHLFFIDRWATASSSVKRVYHIAATEKCPWRNEVLEGEVHDDNAYVVGGVEGHAGLFGTARGVYTILNCLLEGWRNHAQKNVFNPFWVKTMFTQQPDADRALGFDMPSPSGSSSGHLFSPQTVGHLGFTGTSFWVDLPRSIIVILLTNRVHPTRDNDKIKQFRPMLHDAVMRQLI